MAEYSISRVEVVSSRGTRRGGERGGNGTSNKRREQEARFRRKPQRLQRDQQDGGA